MAELGFLSKIWNKKQYVERSDTSTDIESGSVVQQVRIREISARSYADDPFLAYLSYFGCIVLYNFAVAVMRFIGYFPVIYASKALFFDIFDITDPDLLSGIRLLAVLASGLGTACICSFIVGVILDLLFSHHDLVYLTEKNPNPRYSRFRALVKHLLLPVPMEIPFCLLFGWVLGYNAEELRQLFVALVGIFFPSGAIALYPILAIRIGYNETRAPITAVPIENGMLANETVSSVGTQLVPSRQEHVVIEHVHSPIASQYNSAVPVI